MRAHASQYDSVGTCVTAAVSCRSGGGRHLLADGWALYFVQSITRLLLTDRVCTLLPFVLLTLVSRAIGLGSAWTFFFALVGVLPLAERLGIVTEQLTLYTNPTVGGLVNATFGNSVELLVSGLALRKVRDGSAQLQRRHCRPLPPLHRPKPFPTLPGHDTHRAADAAGIGAEQHASSAWQRLLDRRLAIQDTALRQGRGRRKLGHSAAGRADSHVAQPAAGHTHGVLLGFMQRCVEAAPARSDTHA